MTPTLRNNSSLWIFCALTLPALALGTLVACGDDGLGKSFQAREITEEDLDLGEKSPLEVGTQMWFGFGSTYEREATQVSETELWSAGHMCLQIDEIKDTATMDYKDEAQTVVAARVKIVGSVSNSNLDYGDQLNAGISAEDVDSAVNALWLKQATVPSVNHGFENATNVDFNTQEPVRPPNVMLKNLPFIEVRQQANKGWSGWTGLGGDEFQDADNFMKQVQDYFSDKFGTAMLTDRTKFRVSQVTPSADCAELESRVDCENSMGCTWSNVTGAGQECLGIYEYKVMWRDTITEPADQAGDVLHFVKYHYYASGELNLAEEQIIPDTLPADTNLPNEPPFCASRCFVSYLQHQGTFDSRPDYPAPCGF